MCSRITHRASTPKNIIETALRERTRIVIQSILRHSTVEVTQRCYIKTSSKDSVSAMQRLSDEVEPTNCSPLVLQNEVGGKKVTIQ